MTTLRLKRFVWWAFVPVATLVHGADSTVPSSWNVAPITAGAYLEAFDSAQPTWSSRTGASVVTADFPSMSGSLLPARSNAWFGTNSKVLQLDTDGTVLTNAVAYPGAEGDVSYATKPVYVDMRMRFDAMPDGPEVKLLTDAKLALFVSGECKLVAIHANGWTTNSTVLDTNNWYQVTVKMLNGKFDVLLNDQVVFSDLDLMNTAGNTVKAANFYGTGLVDELYISHGDPAYTVTGPTTTIPGLPAAGSNPPTDEQQTRINAWLSTKSGITPSTTLSMTQDQLSQSYLIGELGGDEETATAASCEFGISKIEMTSPTLLQVTVSLTANSTAKNGTINGRIQLQGKVGIGDGWTTLDGAITPSCADFTDGKATYSYAIPEGGYKFFRPLIVP